MLPLGDPNSTSTSPFRTLKNNLLLRTLAGQTVGTPPVWLMRQAGRYLDEYRKLREKFPDFMEMCRSPQATTELALQPLRRFELDAAIVFSDILTIAEGLDLGLKFVPNVGPVISSPIENPSQVTKLPYQACCDRLSYVYEAVSHLRAALGDQLPIIGFAGSPWTQSCYMISGRSEANFLQAKRFAYTHPAAMTELIKNLSIITAEYLLRQYQAGADVLFIIDSWGGILSDNAFLEYSAKALLQICQILQQSNCHAPIMFYSKNISQNRLTMFSKAPLLRGVCLDWTANLPELLTNNPNLTFQGNLDPTILLAGPQHTQYHCQELLKTIRPQSNYIASLGHGVLPKTPINSVLSFINTVRNS